MLQQTTVVTVMPYFQRFIATWPTVQDLAAATLEEVLTAWQGLGYYTRARNLHKTAQIIAQTGNFPKAPDALRQLPGIGPYSADAIAAIAFAHPVIPLDGNIRRIMARLHTLSETGPVLDLGARALAQAFAHPKYAGALTQALMDLGAMVCTPKAPDCDSCPLNQHCAAAALGEATAFPVMLPKAPRPRRYAMAFVEHCAHTLRLEQRPDKGLLAKMMGVPTTPWLPIPQDPDVADFDHCGTVKHVFTHFELYVDVLKRAHAKPLPNAALIAILPQLPIPTLFKKIIRQAGIDPWKTKI